MSHTNSTSNYGLPQWIGTDKPTFLGDFNSAFYEIDSQMKTNADAAAAATTTANTAASAASAASTNANTALNAANSAVSEAASATSAAASATSTANNAASDASAALRASAANTIENLAPAYDPTLTYTVGDLVTYIDEQNSGKLYKCIVAVSSPEAFNINKWDDVTTSEVFGLKGELIYSIAADGVKTWAELLNSIGSNVVFEIHCEYILEIQFSTGTLFLHTRYVSSDATFNDITGLSSTVVLTRYIIRAAASNVKAYTVGSGTLTIEDNTSLVPTDITIKLYKQYTV